MGLGIVHPKYTKPSAEYNLRSRDSVCWSNSSCNFSRLKSLHKDRWLLSLFHIVNILGLSKLMEVNQNLNLVRFPKIYQWIYIMLIGRLTLINIKIGGYYLSNLRRISGIITRLRLSINFDKLWLTLINPKCLQCIMLCKLAPCKGGSHPDFHTNWLSSYSMIVGM